MKFTGNIQPAVSPRLEDIEQMTVQTDQLDLNSGFGQSSTQVNFVSRRGSNQFHGRAYEDFRNSGLNANSWTNDVNGLRKNKLIMNDFGGSVGGPILHDKLFFFGTFAMRKMPGSFTATNDIFTAAAQSGNFTYTGTDGQTHTANLLADRAPEQSQSPGHGQFRDRRGVLRHQHRGQVRLGHCDIQCQFQSDCLASKLAHDLLLSRGAGRLQSHRRRPGCICRGL